MRDLSLAKELIDASVVSISAVGNNLDLRVIVTWFSSFGYQEKGYQVVENMEELDKLYTLWNNFGEQGRIVWLAKKIGHLPIFYRVAELRACGINVDSLELPPHPRDEEYMIKLNFKKDTHAV